MRYSVTTSNENTRLDLSFDGANARKEDVIKFGLQNMIGSVQESIIRDLHATNDMDYMDELDYYYSSFLIEVWDQILEIFFVEISHYNHVLFKKNKT